MLPIRQACAFCRLLEEFDALWQRAPVIHYGECKQKQRIGGLDVKTRFDVLDVIVILGQPQDHTHDAARAA